MKITPISHGVTMRKQTMRQRRGSRIIQTMASSSTSVRQRRCPVEPVRQVLNVPTDPGGQGTVLVVLIHRGQVAPFGVAAEQLHQARFEVDAEPLPLQQEQAGA